MRVHVLYNDLWPGPLTFRSFSTDFAIKLLKYGTSCHVHSTVCTVLDGYFPYLAQMITSIRGCAAYNHLWPWPKYIYIYISSRPFSHDFAIKLLKYGPSCCVRSTAHTVLNEFVPYLAQMITSMRGCVAHNGIWRAPIFQGYLAVTPIDIIIFICGTNTTHEGTICYVPFPGE